MGTTVIIVLILECDNALMYIFPLVSLLIVLKINQPAAIIGIFVDGNAKVLEG